MVPNKCFSSLSGSSQVRRQQEDADADGTPQKPSRKGKARRFAGPSRRGGDDRSWWPAKARLAFRVPSPSRLLPSPPAHMGREIALHWRSPSHPSPRSTCPARWPWHHADSDPSGFTPRYLQK
ncbi:hypothetical protein SRHO_G00050520 [Serrasalmus rhombeus]